MNRINKLKIISRFLMDHKKDDTDSRKDADKSSKRMNAKEELKKRVIELLRNYTKRPSLHGIPVIFNATVKRWSRLMWLIILISCWIFAIVVSSNLTNEYLKYKTKTVYSLAYEPKRTFPGILSFFHF